MKMLVDFFRRASPRFGKAWISEEALFAAQQLGLLLGGQREIIGLLHQFMAVVVEPMEKLPPFLGRQRGHGGFELFHAHGSNFTSPGADGE
jgi:hypothetical protein